MVQKVEHWAEINIGSGKWSTYMFQSGESQSNYQITIDSSVSGNGMDIIYKIYSYQDYQLYRDWVQHPNIQKNDDQGNPVKDSNGYPVFLQRPFPKVRPFLNKRTNQIEKSFVFKPGVYVILFDNTYSAMNSKSLWLHTTESWDHQLSNSNLPLIDQLLDDMPTDVQLCLTDANDCYLSGHYNQCSIMLRKAVEIASKIKLQQSNVNPSQLLDKDGYEISLSKKIKLLQRKNMLTQKSIRDIEHVKWFGDHGAHGTMKITEPDIRDSIEPRARSFLVGLNLKI